MTENSLKWYETESKPHDVVISSRVRLARNLDTFPFAAKSDAETSRKVADTVKNALQTHYGEPLTVTDFSDYKGDKRIFVEDHLISPEFAADSPLKRLLITDAGNTLSVMVGEEDHVRIQAILPGEALDKAYALASRADDALSAGASVAFDETLGYLTACPTNLGTGLRASVMLHLPAMCAYGYVKTLVSLMTKIGLTVRGLYGEGSEALGCMYQLSNQVTLGISESDAIEKLKSAVGQIVAKERELRKQMVNDTGADVRDKLWRSYGTLLYARKLDTAEAARLISNVRLAVCCGLIPEAKNVNFTKLLFEIMPSHIVARFSDAVTPSGRDEARAAYIRGVLA